jgi:hypothetical protein
MVKRAVLLQLGGFDEGIDVAADAHLWYRLACHTDYFFLWRVVALYRQHAGSISHSEMVAQYRRITALRLLLKDPRFRSYRAAVYDRLALLYQEAAYTHRTQAQRWKAGRAAARSVACAPARLAAWRNLLAALVGRR